MATATEANLRWFTAGDVDGFFGLFFSGFPDLLLIVGLAPMCGFPLSFVAGRILPGAAISILAGNLFYAWQARRLAHREGRSDVTAMPLGLDTPSTFAVCYLVLLPALNRGVELHGGNHDIAMTFAWHVGALTLVAVGVFKTLLAPLGNAVRRWYSFALERPVLPQLAEWYQLLGERPGFRTHVMTPVV